METGGEKGASAPVADKRVRMNKNAPDNPSDSLSVQMKNTKAQVLGAWQKVSSSFRQAGKKVSGAVKGKGSSTN